MHVCCREGEVRPCLSFQIAVEAVAYRVELRDGAFVVRDYPKTYVALEGTLWVLIPARFSVWNEELGCEVKPSFGKRFYLSTCTQDPFHYLMEW